MSKSLEKSIKLLLGLLAIALILSFYISFVFKQTTEQVGDEIYNTSSSIVEKWKLLSDGLGRDYRKTTKADLSFICRKDCTALDILLLDESILKEDIQSSYRNAGLPEIDAGILSNNNGRYVLAGYQIKELHVNNNSTIGVVYLTGVDFQVLQYLNFKYDEMPIDKGLDVDGIIRHSYTQEGEVIVGLSFSL